MTHRLFLNIRAVTKRKPKGYSAIHAELRSAFGPQPSSPPKQQRKRIEQRQFVQTGERATHG